MRFSPTSLLMVLALAPAGFAQVESGPKAGSNLEPLKVLVAILVVASSARHFPQLIERMYSEALDSVFRIVI